MYEINKIYIESKDYLSLAKQYKENFARVTADGNIFPTLIAERKGEIFAIAIAPDMDKNWAFRAGSILRKIGADSLFFIFDARVRTMANENSDKFVRTYKYGSIESLSNETNVCESEITSDCLVFSKATKDDISVKILRYSYNERTIEWSNLGDDDVNFGGNMVDNLQKIFNLQTVLEDSSLLKLEEFKKYTEETIFYYSFREALRCLKNKYGFIVFDLFSIKHFELCDEHIHKNAYEKAQLFLKFLSEQKVICNTTKNALLKVVSEHIAKSTFQSEFSKVILEHKDSFAPQFLNIVKQVENFTFWFHQDCFCPD
jgi:hypothetical protein